MRGTNMDFTLGVRVIRFPNEKCEKDEPLGIVVNDHDLVPAPQQHLHPA